MKNKLIIKSNSLIEASFKLTANQQKFIYVLTSLINREDEDFKTYEIKVKDLVHILDIDAKNIYREIDAITDQLMTKVLKLYTNMDNGKLRVDKMTWFSKVSYVYGEGMVKARFDADLKPFLLKLKANFTKYQLKNIMGMKSQYSMRIYELLKQYEKIGTRVLSIKKLKEIMGIEDKYKLYHQFKQRVLQVAHKEINENTDIYFEFEEIKLGRKVNEIKFIIKSQKATPERVGTASQEIAATIDTVGEEDSVNPYIEELKKVLKEDLTYDELEAILNVADNDIEKIKEKYEISKVSKYENLVGFLISAIIKDYKMPIKNEKPNNKNKFHNFEQRSSKYTKEELERLFKNN